MSTKTGISSEKASKGKDVWVEEQIRGQAVLRSQSQTKQRPQRKDLSSVEGRRLQREIAEVGSRRAARQEGRTKAET